MRITLLLIFCITSQLVYSQEEPNLIGLRLKLHPLMIINPDKPYIQGSTELIIKNKISFEFGLGKRYLDSGVLAGIKPDTAVVDFDGIRLLFDVKYHGVFSKNIPELTDYIGLAYHWTNDLRNIRLVYQSVDTTINPNGINVENCAIQRKINVIALKYGGTFEYNRFGAEGFIAIGLKHKNQYFIGNESYDLGYSELSHFAMLFDPTKGTSLYIGCGLRVSYRLL